MGVKGKRREGRRVNLHEILPMGNGTVFGQVCAKKKKRKRDKFVKVDDPLENGRLGGDIRVMGHETDIAKLTLSLLKNNNSVDGL